MFIVILQKFLAPFSCQSFQQVNFLSSSFASNIFTASSNFFQIIQLCFCSYFLIYVYYIWIKVIPMHSIGMLTLDCFVLLFQINQPFPLNFSPPQVLRTWVTSRQIFFHSIAYMTLSSTTSRVFN